MSDQVNETVDWNDESNQSMSERRGQFLLVLCILSWIGIGMGLITTLFNYSRGTADIEAQLDEFESLGEVDTGSSLLNSFTDGAKDMAIKTIENFQAINLSTLLALLLGGLAVYMMFNLKKTGYYLYILYCLATPAISIYFLGANQAVYLSVMVGALFSVAFIIMYGVNVKRMTA